MWVNNDGQWYFNIVLKTVNFFRKNNWLFILININLIKIICVGEVMVV